MVGRSLLFVLMSGLSLALARPALAAPGDIYVGGYRKILKYSGQTGAYLSAVSESSLWSAPKELGFGPDGNLYGLGWNDKVIRYEFATGITSVFVDHAPQLAPEGAYGLAIEPIPDPTTLSLLAVGGLAMLRRRRR